MFQLTEYEYNASMSQIAAVRINWTNLIIKNRGNKNIKVTNRQKNPVTTFHSAAFQRIDKQT